MGWFSRKPKKPAEPSPHELRVAQLQAWRPIGGTFKYLGRECAVTGYSECAIGLYTGYHEWARLKADYADDTGVIRFISFSWQEAVAVMEANP